MEKREFAKNEICEIIKFYFFVGRKYSSFFFNFFKNGNYKNNSNDDLGFLSDTEIYKNINSRQLKNKQNVKIQNKSAHQFFWTKIPTSNWNFHFWPKFGFFWPKFGVLNEIPISCLKFHFWPKCWFFGQNFHVYPNFHVWPKFRFLTKIFILTKILIFVKIFCSNCYWSTFLFFLIICHRNFGHKLNLLVKCEFFLQQSMFWSNGIILANNRFFGRTPKFCPKNSIFVNFWPSFIFWSNI